MTTDRLRVLIVANMYPSPERPAFGVFVADQVAALRATGEVDIDGLPLGRAPPALALRPGAALEARPEPPPTPTSCTPTTASRAWSPWRRRAACRSCSPFTGATAIIRVVKRLTALVARRAAAVVAVSQELAGQCPFPVTGRHPDRSRPRAVPASPPRRARARLGLDLERRTARLSRRPGATRKALRRRPRARRAPDAARDDAPPSSYAPCSDGRATRCRCG